MPDSITDAVFQRPAYNPYNPYDDEEERRRRNELDFGMDNDSSSSGGSSVSSDNSYDPTMVGSRGDYLRPGPRVNDAATQPLHSTDLDDFDDFDQAFRGRGGAPRIPVSGGFDEVYPLSDQGQHPDQPATSEEAASSDNLERARLSSQGEPVTAGHTGGQSGQPALDAYLKSISTMPEQKPIKLWQRLAAGALGGVAGWQNATGHRGVPQIDPSAAIHNIYNGGYDQELANWNAQNTKLGKLATVEQQEKRNAAYLATAEARQLDYQAALKLREYQLQKAQNAPVSLSKAQQAIADRDEREKWAAARKMTEETHPGVTRFVATGDWPNAPAAEHKQAVPAEYWNMNPEQIEKQQKINNDLKVAQTANYNWLAQGEKRGGGGAGGEKPLTHVQKLKGLRQANRDKAESYRRLETGIAADMKAMGLTKGVDPMPDELKAKYDPVKQDIEDQYANDISDYTGNDTKPFEYDFRKGEPAIKKEVVQPVQPVVKPIVRPPGVPGLVNRTPVMQAQPQPAAAARPANLPAAPNVPKPKVATPEMIQQFAKHYNISIDQARNQVLHEGYTVLGR